MRTPSSCSTNSALPPILKKAPRWPSPLQRTSSTAAHGRSSPPTTPRSRSTPPTPPACSTPPPASMKLTLIPNYQLRLGVPGASAGIQTAERLGLNRTIVAAARDASVRSRSTSPASSINCTTIFPRSKPNESRTRAAIRPQPGTRQAGPRRRRRTPQPHPRTRNQARLADEGIRISDARERPRHRRPRRAAKALQRSRTPHHPPAPRILRRASTRPSSPTAPAPTPATPTPSRTSSASPPATRSASSP